MVSYCSNPKCGKPLHYLREGKIYLFDVPDPDAPVSSNGHLTRKLEHFWLCGRCSEILSLEQVKDRDIRLAPKSAPKPALAS